MRLLILITLLFSSITFAQSKKIYKINKRIQQINSEVLKLKAEIKNQGDSFILKDYLSRFEIEKSELQGKLEIMTRLPAQVEKSNSSLYEQAGKDLKKEEGILKKLNDAIKSGVDKKYLQKSIDAVSKKITSLKKKRKELEVLLPKKSLKDISSKKTKKRYGLQGQFRWRYRNGRDVGYNAGPSGPFANFHDLRLRAGYKVKANDYTDIYFEAHADKNFGGRGGFLGNNGTTGVPTSGSGNDDIVGLHQAYALSQVTDSLRLQIGRQILQYGDDLIISPLEWDNTGRVFDAFRARYKLGSGWIDAFYSVLDQGRTVSVGRTSDDDQFAGIYSSFNLGNYFKELDFYLLFRSEKNDRVTGTTTIPTQNELKIAGIRAKSKFGSFDYRFEAAVQEEKRLNSTSDNPGWQINPEVGYHFSWKKLRLGFQYFAANENYIQLYPLAHGFLGFADMFGRRNIEGTAYQVSFSPIKKFIFKAHYHLFNRQTVDAPAYRLNGATAYNSSSQSDDLGSELDLTLIWKAGKRNKVIFGLAHFMPGEYIEQVANNDESYSLAYLLYNIKF